MRKLLLVLAWIPSSTLTLFFCLKLLVSYSKAYSKPDLFALQAREMLPKNGYQFYASLPQVLGSFSVAVAKEDARPEILRQFLVRHQSPLEKYAPYIVERSDYHNIDFRLITAIAMCESNAGKRMPEGSYNAFGYAIYTGQNNGTSFNDWQHAIDIMAKYLSEKYYSRGLTTPEQIGPIYAPPSVNTGHSWAKCVRQFMEELM